MNTLRYASFEEYFKDDNNLIIRSEKFDQDFNDLSSDTKLKIKNWMRSSWCSSREVIE